MTATKKMPAKTRRMLKEMILLLRGEHPDVAIPKGAFDMNTWRADDEDCGTVACAMGWAATLLPSYRKLYTFETMRYYDKEFALKCQDPYMQEHTALGLTAEAYEYLFHGIHYKAENVTPKMVAKRIEQFLEDGKIKLLPD